MSRKTYGELMVRKSCHACKKIESCETFDRNSGEEESCAEWELEEYEAFCKRRGIRMEVKVIDKMEVESVGISPEGVGIRAKVLESHTELIESIKNEDTKNKVFGTGFVTELIGLMRGMQGNKNVLDRLRIIPLSKTPPILGSPPLHENMYVMICTKCNGGETISPDALPEDIPQVHIWRKHIAYEDEGLIMLWIGVCRTCGTRYVAAEMDLLKRLAYFAVFGDWPK